MTQNHDTSLNVDTLQIVTDLAKRRWYHQAVKGDQIMEYLLLGRSCTGIVKKDNNICWINSSPSLL